MKGKSKVKSQKSKIKSVSTERCAQFVQSELLIFDFCLLTFDLNSPRGY